MTHLASPIRRLERVPPPADRHDPSHPGGTEEFIWWATAITGSLLAPNRSTASLNALLGTERDSPTPQLPLPCLSLSRIRLVPQVIERVRDGGHVGGAER